MDALNGLEPQARVRISSIEVTNLPESLFERMVDPGHVLVPYLHVPLQSGSDAVLKAMRRPYTAGEYLDLLNRAATAVPGIGLGADVMVGFPGETDEDFEATCALVRESPLFYLHVFQYSERGEVTSSRLPGKVPVGIAKSRNEILHRLGEEKKRAFQERHLGHQLRVLFEDREDGLWRGHTDSYLETGAASAMDLTNQYAFVRIESVEKGLLHGSIDELA